MPKKSVMSQHAEKNPHRELQRVVADDEDVRKQLQDHPDLFTVSRGDYQ